MKRSRLKAKPKKVDPAKAPAAEVFWETVTDRGRLPCVVCSNIKASMQAHHVVPAQVVRREVSTDSAVVYDVRNGICVCERCHQKHELRVHPIARRLLPYPALAFAREHNQMHRIERTYP